MGQAAALVFAIADDFIRGAGPPAFNVNRWWAGAADTPSTDGLILRPQLVPPYKASAQIAVPREPLFPQPVPP